jgi:hypothetical protein
MASCQIGLHKAGVGVWQVDRKDVNLALCPGDLRQRLTNVCLRIAEGLERRIRRFCPFSRSRFLIRL